MINLIEGYSELPNFPKFELGEVVQHISYNYRGLIVDCDDTCQSTDEWYQSNQTQPDRNQAWYHLLVDGAKHVTYVAESNLTIDQARTSVVHPLLNLFFFGVDEGNNRYLRNDVPFDPGQPPDALPPPPPQDNPPHPPT